MATTDTITTALTFLTNVLTGDTAFMALVSGVFLSIAPTNTQPDWCVIGVQSPGADTLSANAVRLLAQPLVSVKLVGPAADMANLSAAYARADALLQPSGQPLRNDPVTGTLACYRVSALFLPEPQLINGEPWVNLGGLYRLVLPN